MKADPVLSGYRIEILGEENVKNQEDIILYSKNGYLKYYASIKDGKLNNIECSSFKTLKPIFFSNPAEILVKLDHLYDKVEPTRERILNKIKEIKTEITTRMVVSNIFYSLISINLMSFF